ACAAGGGGKVEARGGVRHGHGGPNPPPGGGSGRARRNGGDGGADVPRRQQDDAEEDAPWLNIPLHERDGSGGGSGDVSSWTARWCEMYGIGKATDEPSSSLDKVVGVPRQARARIVHILYDHGSFVREVEESFGIEIIPVPRTLEQAKLPRIRRRLAATATVGSSRSACSTREIAKNGEATATAPAAKAKTDRVEELDSGDGSGGGEKLGGGSGGGPVAVYAEDGVEANGADVEAFGEEA
ncbi:unnamed protein product, partial [Ectocarpus sp. 12 AP-2014]